MSFKPFSLAGALLCATLVVPALVPRASAAEQDRVGVITVSGQGRVQGEPDRAVVTLGVEARRLKMEDARAEVTKTVAAVLELTRDMDIDPKHVRTTRVNIQPEYTWDNAGRDRRLVGYYVSRQVEIDLRNLDRLGELLERAFDLGVNQVGDPQLDSTKRRDLERDLLVRAMDDARLNAETIARSAGGQLGAVRKVTASTSYASPPRPMQAVAMARAVDSAAAETYQAGELNFTGTVSVEYVMVIVSGR